MASRDAENLVKSPCVSIETLAVRSPLAYESAIRIASLIGTTDRVQGVVDTLYYFAVVALVLGSISSRRELSFDSCL